MQPALLFFLNINRRLVQSRVERGDSSPFTLLGFIKRYKKASRIKVGDRLRKIKIGNMFVLEASRCPTINYSRSNLSCLVTR